ncbi:MAG TPA: DUF1353 domain-containing protein [Acidimicrobiales bacterium]|jgi:Protein of unknown function (DUF1353)|nr:DUF1353 domain-containing protein [Acidimicrobiales bacterium]
MDQVTQPSRFYDVATGGPVQVQIEQVGAVYRLVRQFGYRDPGYQKPFIVPDDVDTFTTDLASIPWMFAWLVPGLGTHLPAVLLHDGLVVGRGQPPTHIGPEVNRVEADRILRDAMASLGTPRLRRWLMWTGVTFATCWSDVPHRWWWRVVMPVTLGLVALLGVLATLDLADVWDVLPWMGDRAWWVELASGAAFALLIPLVFSVLWLQFWRAGAIAGVALAFLLHVTAAVVVVYGIYRVAERLASASEGTGPDVNENLRRATATAGDGQVPAPGP